VEGVGFQDAGDYCWRGLPRSGYLLWAAVEIFAVAIGPLRRPTEQFVKSNNQPGLWGSQKQLLSFALIMAIVCVPLIVLGFAIYIYLRITSAWFFRRCVLATGKRSQISALASFSAPVCLKLFPPPLPPLPSRYPSEYGCGKEEDNPARDNFPSSGG